MVTLTKIRSSVQTTTSKETARVPVLPISKAAQKTYSYYTVRILYNVTHVLLESCEHTKSNLQYLNRAYKSN